MKRRSRGLGSNVSADAREAIRLARVGKCGAAIRHLYNAAPHMQVDPSKDPAYFRKAESSYRIASIIVSKQCSGGGEKPHVAKYKVGGKKRRMHHAGFDGIKSFRRVKRKRRP